MPRESRQSFGQNVNTNLFGGVAADRNSSSSTAPAPAPASVFEHKLQLPSGVLTCHLGVNNQQAEKTHKELSGSWRQNAKRTANPIFTAKPSHSEVFVEMHSMCMVLFGQAWERANNLNAKANQISQEENIWRAKDIINKYSTNVFDLMSETLTRLESTMMVDTAHEQKTINLEVDQLKVAVATWELCHLLLLNIEDSYTIGHRLQKWYIKNYIRDEIVEMIQQAKNVENKETLWALIFKLAQLDLKQETMQILRKIPEVTEYYPELTEILDSMPSIKDILKPQGAFASEVEYLKGRSENREQARQALFELRREKQNGNGGNTTSRTTFFENAEKLLAIYAGEQVIAETWIEEAVFRFIWCTENLSSKPNLRELFRQGGAEKFESVEISVTDEVFLKIWEGDVAGLISKLGGENFGLNNFAPIMMVVHLVDLFFLAGQMSDEAVRDFYLSEYATFLMDINCFADVFAYLNPILHASLARRNLELFAANEACDEELLSAIQSVKNHRPVIFETLTYFPSCIHSAFRARAQRYKSEGEYARALLWECHADLDEYDSTSSKGRGANISMFLDQLCLYENELSNFLDIFVHDGMKNCSFLAGNHAYANASSRVGSKNNNNINSRLGSKQSEVVANQKNAGFSTSVKVHDLQGEEIELPDVPSGRLHFYASLSYLQRKRGNSFPGADRVSRLVSLICEQGVCPPELLTSIVTDEIMPEAEILSADNLLKLISFLERTQRELISGTHVSSKEPAKVLSGILCKLRSGVGLAMLNSGGLD